MKLLLRVAFFSITICTPASLSAQSDSGSDKSEQAARLPYEVIITPTIRRRDLRELIVQVEDDFFAKFNELNLDDNYDVLCYEYIPTMSHIRQRVCEPWFMIQARGSNASEVAYALAVTPAFGSSISPQSATSLPPRAMRNEVHIQYGSLEEKMEEFTRGNLEFRSIGNALAELKFRLENFGKD